MALSVFDVLVDLIEAEEPIPKQYELAASLGLKTQTLSDYIKVLHELFDKRSPNFSLDVNEEKK